MREVVVLSGKGGTGKTTLAGVFAALGESAVIADVDVDAANLHLILNPEVVEKEPFFGSRVPVVDEERCTRCGLCGKLCRFEAIKDGKLDEIACEGCAVCFHACPAGAITLQDLLSGHVYVTNTVFGPFVYAELGIARENSGKLVSRVKRRARQIAETKNKAYIVVDGPPGIGCPVIASVSGADLVLVVTEPTAAGLHDLNRILGLARHFNVRPAVCINKADLDEKMAEEIESHCLKKGVAFLGCIPFAKGVVKATVARSPVSDRFAGPAARAMQEVWKQALSLL
ncbi:MAG: ATP-binding protein [Bacillota bacterium]